MNHSLNFLLRNVIGIVTVAIVTFGSPAAFALTTNTANGITYLTGGVTLDERQEMADQRKNFSLLLKFAAKSGRYLGDVSVNITNRKGAPVFESTTDGPWLLVNLPAGSYTLKATSGGVSQLQKISIGQNARRELTMYWNVVDKDDAKE
jgi:hypothetical protein